MAERGKGKIDFPPNPAMADKLAAALGNQEKKEEEIIPVTQTAASFDSAAYVKKANKEYLDLGKKIKKIGIKPDEMPDESWGPANIALDAIQKLSEEYDKESDVGKKEKIATHMRRLGTSLGGRINGEVTRAAKELASRNEEIGILMRKAMGNVSEEEPSRQTESATEAAAGVPQVEAVDESKVIPPELSNIFGDKVPRRVLKMYGGLTDPITKKSVIDQLTADEAKKKQQKEKKADVAPAAPPVPEKPVQAPEQPAPTLDVDESTLKAPQYGKGKMQEEMDALSREASVPPEPEIEVETLVGGSDTTPKEEREKLRGLLGKFEALEKEKIPEQSAPAEKGRVGFNERTEQLTNRSNELNVRAEKLGWVERSFRSLGERYNKLSFIKKLGLGVALGLGAAVFSAVSIPTALAFTGGLAAQRAAGMASTFLKIENYLQNKAGEGKKVVAGKEKAMAGAMLYTLGMGYAIKEAVEYVGETEFVHSIREWLKDHYPFGSAATPPPHTEAAPVAVHPVEAMHDRMTDIAEIRRIDNLTAGGAAATPDVSTPVAAGEALSAITPDVSIGVEATPGHGYEFMAKRLWEQLQGKGLDPNQYAEGSDIRRLLEADPKSIDTVVHDLAKDNEFFKPDGSNVQINLGEKMSFDAKGNLWLGENILAPEGAHVTLPYHSEVPGPFESTMIHETGVTPEPVQPLEAPEYQNITVAPPPETLPPPPASMVEHAAEFVNQLKVSIDPTHGHVFKDTTGAAIAYGKEALDAAQEFAKVHPDTSVWVQAEKPVLVDGVLKPYVFEVKYGGFIFKNMQILSPDVPAAANLIGAIDPETFVEQLDK